MAPVESLLRRFQPHRRRTWIPVVERGKGAVSDSKYRGHALLLEGERWPSCGLCRNSLLLAVQLNLATIPEAMKPVAGRGVLQLFACDEGCYDEKDTSYRLVRRIPTGAKTRTGEAPPPSKYSDATPRVIRDWKEAPDYPASGDRKTLGIALDEVEEFVLHDRVTGCHREVARVLKGKNNFDAWVDEDDRKAGLTAENLASLAELDARQGDKLGGWPAWEQAASYPACRVCSTGMTFLYQLSTKWRADYWSRGWYDIFACDGAAQIFACPLHPDVVDLDWACG